MDKSDAVRLVIDTINDRMPLIDALCSKIGVTVPGASLLLGNAIRDGVLSVDQIQFGDLAYVDDAFHGDLASTIDNCAQMIRDNWTCDWGEIVGGKWIVGDQPLYDLRDIVTNHVTDVEFVEFLCSDGDLAPDEYFGGFSDSEKQSAYGIIRNCIK